MPHTSSSISTLLPEPSEVDNFQSASEPKKRRGAKSSLSDAQVETIQSFFPEMERLLVKLKLHAGKEQEKATNPSELTAWFDQTITKILKMEEFESLDKTKKTPAQWCIVICDVFKNYRNNTFIPKNQKMFALRYLRLENNNQHSSDESVRAVDALVSFKTPATAKKLFEQENKDTILELMHQKIAKCKEDALLGDTGGSLRPTNTAALYQIALSELWEEADQDHYINEAKLDDVFKFGDSSILMIMPLSSFSRNQATFSHAMYTSLCAFAEGGTIGPAEMQLFVGYRDENKVVQCLRLHAYHRYDPDNTIKAFPEGEDAVKLEISWEKFCKETLPYHPKQSPKSPQHLRVIPTKNLARIYRAKKYQNY
ncbi:hypothetical protein GGU10DRAFT_337423 [Lentinula aff. detonsa]|uniref:Uncharacterized protein n=1 Tax=Lentinula aff. detonsa TaxID=2804958 RepID=A0AA38KD31_9AGAR|nr:hypothetical protein GGU10DRAFT_337423 [Lentinula aff. detonsa]